ncbi:EVE domain-containing protein [Porticoccaceae bacterium LTM1]|nr:EVE domain-containing protein [Porticoccaceae bacterium LTM1]
MKYWLFKSEPDEYSIDQLAAEPNQTGHWNGIRNYQARNLLRDQVSVNDQVFFYHSSCKPAGIIGVMKVVKAAYPDPDQFNPESKYFDPKATAENPRWFCVDVQLEQKFPRLIPLTEIKATKALENMTLVKQGRLSVQPVTENEWGTLLKML